MKRWQEAIAFMAAGLMLAETAFAQSYGTQPGSDEVPGQDEATS